jgi:two-component system OmpR family response regulator
MRLLVVEDDERMAGLLGRGLRAEGYAVDTCGSRAEGHWLATENPYDVLICDVMLPDGDGFALCRDLRSAGRWSPILMLTARDAVADRVQGLDAGADDYLAKPFAFDELLARVRALLRRGSHERPAVLAVGSLRLDPASRAVTAGDRPVDLALKEFALLELLMRHAGQVLSRAQILDHVWDWAYEGASNVIDVHVLALRRKLGTSPGLPRIETVRGVGYVLREADG